MSSTAFIVPLALSASSSPSPNHPRVLLWYGLLRKPSFKPADWVIPLAWLGIERALAAATLIANGAEFVLQARPVDRAASRAGLPLVALVSFATALSATIWHLNRQRGGRQGSFRAWYISPSEKGMPAADDLFQACLRGIHCDAGSC